MLFLIEGAAADDLGPCPTAMGYPAGATQAGAGVDGVAPRPTAIDDHPGAARVAAWEHLFCRMPR
ncbi:MAG TPA: hypothetical protein VGJ57_09070 [Nitrospirales bacterium]